MMTVIGGEYNVIHLYSIQDWGGLASLKLRSITKGHMSSKWSISQT